MDLITIPIMFTHVCSSMSCIDQTNYITITDLDLFVIGVNSICGFFIAKLWKDSRKSKQQRLTEVKQ